MTAYRDRLAAALRETAITTRTWADHADALVADGWRRIDPDDDALVERAARGMTPVDLSGKRNVQPHSRGRARAVLRELLGGDDG